MARPVVALRDSIVLDGFRADPTHISGIGIPNRCILSRLCRVDRRRLFGASAGGIGSRFGSRRCAVSASAATSLAAALDVVVGGAGLDLGRHVVSGEVVVE